MANITSTTLANTFTTMLSANIIKNLQNDFFLKDFLINQVEVTGVRIEQGNGAEKASVKVMPTLTASNRVEDNNITPQTGAFGEIEVAIDHRPGLAIGFTAQAGEKSIFGASNGNIIDNTTIPVAQANDMLSNLLNLYSNPATDAIYNYFQTNAVQDITLDTDIPAGNKYATAATGGILDFTPAFFSGLNKRYKDDKAPIQGASKTLLVSTADFATLTNQSGLFDINFNNANGVPLDDDTVYLPNYKWAIRQTTDLHTEGGKVQRIAMTSNSAVVATGKLDPIYNETVALTNDGKLNFRLDIKGDSANETNTMYLTSKFGVKVYQPKNVYIIEDAT